MRSFAGKTLAVLMAVAGIQGWYAAHSAAYARGWVKVVNETDLAIFHLYLSFSRDDQWEEDVLGDNVLSSGYNQTFTIRRGGCYVDFKAIMEDGTAVEHRGENVCNGFTWTIYD